MRKVDTGVWYGVINKLAEEWTDPDTGKLMDWSSIDKKTRKHFNKVEFLHLRDEILQYKKDKANGTTIK